MKTLSTSLLLLGLLSQFVAPRTVPGQGPAKEHFGKPQTFWLERLRSQDALERDEAIQVFARVGAEGCEAVPLLRPLLKDANLTTRLQVAKALWKVQENGKDAAPTLAEDFPRMSPAQQAEIVTFVLGQKKVDEATFVMYGVFMKVPQFTQLVSYRLSSLGADALPQYGKWLERSQGKDRADLIAKTPLTLLSASRGEIVVPFLKDADPLCQATAAAVLLTLPDRFDAAVDVLIPLAGSPDKEVANRAMWALCSERAARKALPVYLQALKHPNLAYRLAAVQPVLGLAPEQAEAVVPILEEALNDPNFQTRFKVYPLVAELKGKGEKLVPLLVAKLKEPQFATETSWILSALVPHAQRVGKEVGDIYFADIKTAQRFLNPVFRPFTPHFADTISRHLDGEDANHRKLAVIAIRWFPPAGAGKFIPRLPPLLKEAAITESVLLTLESLGKEAGVAAPEVFALLEGNPPPPRVATIQRTLLRLAPEPRVLAGFLDRLKAKTDLRPEVRILAAELALLHPERHKEAADFLEPLFAGKATVRSFDLKRTAEKLGPDAIKLLPALHARLKEDYSPLLYYDRLLILLGPAAREVVPTLLGHTEKLVDYSELMRVALVVSALDPDKRLPLDERINKLFLERLEKYPTGSELGYHYSRLLSLCTEPPGATRALVPLLRKAFHDAPRDEFRSTREDLRAELAVPLSRLDEEAATEVLRLLEGELGTFPQCSQGAMIGLLRLNPKHPRALAELKKYLDDANRLMLRFAVQVAVRCDRTLPEIRERLEAILKNSPDLHLKVPIRLTLMRYDGKLNPEWIDEILSEAERDHVLLWELPTLGVLAKPLVPRLRTLRVSESSINGHEEIIFKIERSR